MLLMKRLRNDREPLSVFQIDHMIFLGILILIISDRGVPRNDIVLVDDRITDSAVFSDIHIIEEDAVVDGRIAVDMHGVEKHGIGDCASGNDTAVTDDGVDRLSDSGQTVGIDFLVMNEFRGRQTEMVVVDRPFVIVKIKLRLRFAKVHVGFEIRLQRSDIAPVWFLGDILSGDLVGIEVVSKKALGFDQARNDVFPEVVRTAFFRIVVLQKAQHIVGIEDVIPHGCERHVLVVRQRRGIFRFFLESNDPPVLIHLNDAELAGFRDRDGNRRNGRDRVVAHVEIDHLADIHLVDMVAAEDCNKIGFEILDQVHVLVDGISCTAVPGAVGRLHLRRNGDDEIAAHLSR